MQRLTVLLAGIFAISATAFSQTLIVTAEGHKGAAPPALNKDDIQVQVENKPVAVQSWTPLRGDQAALDLYIVIDDGTTSDLGLQFASLKNFINSQPPSTRVGLAYLRNGAAMVAAPLTADHAKAVKALRLPLAEPGISSSPYMGISDILKKWPATESRREVLLISSGIDPWSPPDPQNPYLQTAIADAQRARVIVNSIYYAEAGHLGHSYWRVNWGQNYLSELGDETGGELYWQGTASPVSLEPYLKDLTQHLENQYLLTVEAPARKNELEPVKVTTNKPGVSLLTASKIYLHR